MSDVLMSLLSLQSRLEFHGSDSMGPIRGSLTRENWVSGGRIFVPTIKFVTKRANGGQRGPPDWGPTGAHATDLDPGRAFTRSKEAI